jgi:hypothetical protein
MAASMGQVTARWPPPSPKRWNAVGSYARIAGDQRGSFHHRLCDEEAVEGIALQLTVQLYVGQSTISICMRGRNRQQ